MSYAHFGFRRLLTGVAVSSLLGLAAGPALAEVSTLEDALVTAYRTNPTLLAQRALLRATDENVAQAVSNWRPVISASGRFGRSETTSTSTTFDPNSGQPILANTTTTYDSRNYTISGQQTVFRGGRTFNEFRQAKANVQTARAQLVSVEQQTLFDALSAYMDVLRDEAVVRLAQNNVQVLQRQLEAAQDRFRVGEITRTDVAQAQARLKGSESNLTAAEAQLTASRAAFVSSIGEEPGSLESAPELPPLPESLDAATQLAKDNNPTLRAARESERSSRLGIHVAAGALLPTISVQATYGENDTNLVDFLNSKSKRDNTSLTASVSVPLYQGGAEYSRIRQAKQINSEDRMRIIEAERGVTELVQNTWEGLRSARATILSSREQVRANEIAFEGVQQEAQVGSRTTLDVLNAEQELLNARVSLVRAERDEYVAAFALLAAVGRLTAQDLGLATDYYDPEVHYDSVKAMPIGWWSRDE